MGLQSDRSRAWHTWLNGLDIQGVAYVPCSSSCLSAGSLDGVVDSGYLYLSILLNRHNEGMHFLRMSFIN